MSEQIIQIAYRLVNYVPTRVPAMTGKQLSELLWWIQYFDDDRYGETGILVDAVPVAS
ncbi:hypothetical protein [Pantoea ananatis]|uniref:hypothetical protein n=1 Tax=Pantoea ananas TaxID=553 RepID=UPI001B315EED|nr:hypothetical protein [Pantoea ananatis]